MVLPAALFERIKKTIQKIENDLKTTNDTGIYFAPELYISFCIGLDIYKDRQIVFGTQDIKWGRETNLGNGGPSDIVFELGDTRFVIELKLRNKINAYEADIEKLKLLKADEKYFCVLLDSFTNNNDDGRLLALKSKYENQIINVDNHSFLTWNNWYAKQVYCNLNLYRLI